MTLVEKAPATVDGGYPRGKRRYGSDIIADLLQQYEIPYVALNPGASYRGLHDSIVQRGGNNPELILCQHEEIAVQIAHGYAKATGKPMAAILHDVVGLLHACLAIYYAYLDRAPILILGATGPMNEAKRRPHIDWIHSANVQGNAVRDYTKWDDQPSAAEGIPGSFARGYRVATTEPQGPVYLCYDAALQEDPLVNDVELPPPNAARTPSRMAAESAALERVADLLARAERPVLIAEYLGRDPAAFDALVRLAETAGAPVVDIGSRLSFPSNHPLNMTDTDVLREADLVVMLDVRDAEREISVLESATRKVTRIVPPECQFVEIGFADLELSSWSMDYGRLQDMRLSVLGDTSLAVPALTDLVASRVDAGRVHGRTEQIARRHAQARERWLAEARENWDAVPMTTGRLALEVWAAIKNEDWVLTAGGLKDWAHKLWDFDKAYRHPGRELGTATQIGISLGVALGHKGGQNGRLVVDLQPDGDLMFDLGALWIAAKYQIPILVVMYNNRAYYNDWEHQLRMARVRGTDPERAYIGMDINDPAPDFAKLAQAQGWYAEGPIEHGDQVAPALRRAIEVVKSGRPALIDTVTQFR
jgi:acetolactate synthase I/II/III large subunit